MVLSLIARRFVENSHANPRIMAMPSTPVHLPMSNPPAIDSGADEPANQGLLFPSRTLADEIAAGNQRFRFCKFGTAIVMNGGQRFADFHAIADALVKFEAHAVIDLVFLLLAATAQQGERDSKLFTVRAGDEAAGGTCYVDMQTRGGQAFRLFNDAFIAALQANPLPEFFECFPRGDHEFAEAAAFLHALRFPTEIEHPRGKFEAQVSQIGGAAAFFDPHGLPALV